MTSVVVYTGQAGTGKTTCIMNKLKELIPQLDWKEYQSILALTFMHGSRKRLYQKLSFVNNEYHLRYSCLTIDSFALALLNKFRNYLNISNVITPHVADENLSSTNMNECLLTLEEIHLQCIDLLENESVKKYIKNSYPIILVDEFQDCIGTLFEIVKRLSLSSYLLIASDPFQQLNESESYENIIWINDNPFEKHDLDSQRNWRTNNSQILNSAKALRTGIKNVGTKIKVFPCFNKKNVTSAIVKQNIFYNWSNSRSIAIISPSSNPLTERVLDELNTPYIFNKGKLKGKVIPSWGKFLSTTKKIKASDLMDQFSEQVFTRNNLLQLRLSNDFILRRSAGIALRKMSLRNTNSVDRTFFSIIIANVVHYFNHFVMSEHNSKIIYSTVHGAKNREFDSVIIIWPYQVKGDLLYKRKLLYNAITRARKSAILLVQQNKYDLEKLKRDELFGLIIN